MTIASDVKLFHAPESVVRVLTDAHRSVTDELDERNTRIEQLDEQLSAVTARRDELLVEQAALRESLDAIAEQEADAEAKRAAAAAKKAAKEAGA